ncbi:MAG: hypothetical protein QJR08_05025 [Bacillota bacterium]|nr:hypothetical protein [Bacillota bacterium]
MPRNARTSELGDFVAALAGARDFLQVLGLVQELLLAPLGYDPADILAGNLVGDELPDLTLFDRDGVPVAMIAIGEEGRLEPPPPLYDRYIRALGSVQWMLTVAPGGLTGWELPPGRWTWKDIRPSLRLDLSAEELDRGRIQALQRWLGLLDQGRLTRNNRQRVKRRNRVENGAAPAAADGERAPNGGSPSPVRVWTAEALLAGVPGGEGEEPLGLVDSSSLSAFLGAAEREGKGESGAALTGRLVTDDRFDFLTPLLTPLADRVADEKGGPGSPRLAFRDLLAFCLAWGVAGESPRGAELIAGDADAHRLLSEMGRRLGAGIKSEPRSFAVRLLARKQAPAAR